MKYNLEALMKYLKDEFGAIHEQFAEMRNNFSSLPGSADKIAVTTVKNNDELKILNVRVGKIEDRAVKSGKRDKVPQKPFTWSPVRCNMPLGLSLSPGRIHAKETRDQGCDNCCS